MNKFQPFYKKRLFAMLAGLAVSGSLQAQYSNYFTNQVFSAPTSTTAGSFNGGTFSISNPNSATLSTWRAQPTNQAGAMPSGSNFPATGPMAHALNSGGGAGTKIITVTPSVQLTPADHVYIEDLDNGESATFRFYAPVSGTLMATGSFRAEAISSGNLNSAFSITKNTSDIALVGGSGLQEQPLLEIIPDAPVGYFTITFNNPNSSGSFAFYFGRNKPVLTQTLSSTGITRGRSTTLTYTLDGINNNPIYQLGFTNALPTGWKIAGIPNATGARGTLSAPANGSTVTLSSLNNSFASSAWTTGTSWSVDVTNADNQMNSSCSGNPAAFSNSPANYTTSATDMTNNVTAVCFTVAAPLPLELRSFTASPDGCSARLRWESSYEKQMAGYDVERSVDGTTWTVIARVPAMNSDVRQVYEFIDKDAPRGGIQYRLRMVGMSDEISFSAIAAVRAGCQGNAAFSVSPNPASGTLSCSFATIPESGAQVGLCLFDLAGRVVAREPANNLSGAVAGFSLPKLSPGLYLVQAMVNGTIAGTGKVTIQ